MDWTKKLHAFYFMCLVWSRGKEAELLGTDGSRDWMKGVYSTHPQFKKNDQSGATTWQQHLPFQGCSPASSSSHSSHWTHISLRISVHLCPPFFLSLSSFSLLFVIVFFLLQLLRLKGLFYFIFLTESVKWKIIQQQEVKQLTESLWVSTAGLLPWRQQEQRNEKEEEVEKEGKF